MNRCTVTLVEAGMSPAEANPKGALFERAVEALPAGRGAGDALHSFFVPGRIEVLGKHTDYAGGRSLVCAVERGFCLAARPRSDEAVTVVNGRTGARCRLALSTEVQPAAQQWCNYPAVAVRRLARNFPGARRGADIAFLSDLPAASGMSSSSAFIVAVCLALIEINAIEESDAFRREVRTREDFAGYLGTVENGESFGTLSGDRGVGTFGGSEDHTAILCCRAGELRQYSFCPVRLERTLPLPDGMTFAVGVSGVVAMKTGAALAKYNRASLAARRIHEIWRAAPGRADPTLAAAVRSAPDAADRIREILRSSGDPEFPAALLSARFEQFLQENEEIVPSAAEALAAGDLVRFGSLVDRSQQLAEQLLGNQVPETIALARSARELGAAAASAFGAGFGGSVWALVPAAEAEEFLRSWSEWYAAQFPAADRVRFFSTRPGPAALRL